MKFINTSCSISFVSSGLRPISQRALNIKCMNVDRSLNLGRL